MITETMINNGTTLLRTYIPWLFSFLSEKDIEIFFKKAYTQTNGIGTSNNNFIATFFMLLDEVRENKSNEIRNEFAYYNFLLSKFIETGDCKKFKDLIASTLYNFSANNFKHVLGEIAACLDLSQQNNFIKYEAPFSNEKCIDFQFEVGSKGNIFIEVYNIDFDCSRYEAKKFSIFLNGRLKKKYEDKTKDLPIEDKIKIYIYPILFEISNDIVKEQEYYLKSLVNSSIETNGFQTIEPKSFGNIQGTFFKLFSIDEIVNPKKYFK